MRYPGGYSVVPRPVYGHGFFISNGFDDPVVFAIRADGKGDVTETHVVEDGERGTAESVAPPRGR